MMKMSCTSSMVPGNTLTEKAEFLKKAGFEGMGVFVEYEDWTPELEQEILTLEERTGIKPCEFCFSADIYGHLMDEDEKIRNAARKMYKRQHLSAQRSVLLPNWSISTARRIRFHSLILMQR